MPVSAVYIIRSHLFAFYDALAPGSLTRLRVVLEILMLYSVDFGEIKEGKFSSERSCDR
jgi:hypothetical protein